jgi:hypothetical protein
MDDELVYCGLRCIGIIRDQGRGYEAWAEPEREGLGRFNTHAAACRALYEHDVEQRAGGAR